MSWKLAYAYALSDGVPLRSLWVALIAGTAGRHLDITKLALTYVVPYFVCTYGAVSFRLREERTHAIPPN